MQMKYYHQHCTLRLTGFLGLLRKPSQFYGKTPFASLVKGSRKCVSTLTLPSLLLQSQLTDLLQSQLTDLQCKGQLIYLHSPNPSHFILRQLLQWFPGDTPHPQVSYTNMARGHGLHFGDHNLTCDISKYLEKKQTVGIDHKILHFIHTLHQRYCFRASIRNTEGPTFLL